MTRTLHPVLLYAALAIAALWAVVGICQAQESAGPLIDRWEARADRIEQRLADSTREQGRIADFFERLSNREGKGILDGTRLATIARGIYWMVMACIGAVTVCAVALAAKYVGEAIKSFRGKT